MSDVNNDRMGAEATVSMTTFLGRDAVVKVRPPKHYRIRELDEQLRASRTKNEARIIREARMAGVRTPCIYDVDLHECSITMERMQGRTIKQVLDEDPLLADMVCSTIGAMVAKLHSAGICHGDLTTSNMIMDDEGGISIIDFSLGCTKANLEDIGVDIRLLERAFTSAHTGLEKSFEVLMESYYANVPNPDAIRKKVEEIRNRGRYT